MCCLRNNYTVIALAMVWSRPEPAELHAAAPPAPSALAWTQHPTHRSAPVTPNATGTTAGFRLLPGSETGIDFTNHLSLERTMFNHNLMNGSGVAAGDFDGDGWCDLFFANVEGSSALYRNLGNWRFARVEVERGLEVRGQASTGAVFADLNGDGALDLLVNSCGGPNACFLNDGRGYFTNVTARAGLVSRYGSTSLALADLEGDGDLDLYVANYGENTVRSGMTISTRMVNGKEVVVGRYASRYKIIDGKLVEFGEPDALYLNDGKGNFTAVNWADGRFRDETGVPLKGPPWDMGLSVVMRDLNGDFAPDIYVCNDFQTPDRIWLNDGAGRFIASDPLAIRILSNFAMGVDVADIDRDGDFDLFVADMLSRFHSLRMTQSDGALQRSPHVIGQISDRPQVRRNTLFLNRGDGTYAEAANFAGLAGSDWTWSAVFLDVDLDGYEDLLIGNGHAFDTQDLDGIQATRGGARDKKQALLIFPRLETPNFAFRNLGNCQFQELGQAWGFDSKQVSHGTALADLDQDGDLDVVVNCLNAPALIYRNESAAPRVAVRLKGRAPNTQGVGARVELQGGAVARQQQEIVAGGRYLSGDDPMRVFAAGKSTDLTLRVRWRSGGETILRGVQPNCIYEVFEPEPGDDKMKLTEERKKPVALMQEVSGALNHSHHEDAFDDFALQRLLPRRLSQLGPGVAWQDFDRDGHADLLIGSGSGGQPAVYRGDGKGAFARIPYAGPANRRGDDAGLAAWCSTQGSSLLLARSNYETGTNQLGLVRIEIADQRAVEIAVADPGFHAAVGPLATGDIDGDGDLDLFVGSRVARGRYPLAEGGRLLRNENGRLTADAINAEVWTNAAMITAAVFSDLNGDGLPELILAQEWGPVRIYGNQSGRFTERTEPLGLERYSGLWNGVTTGDFDGDGQLDVVAANWGLNSSFQPSPESPDALFAEDLGPDGSYELLEAYTDRLTRLLVPHRNLDVLSAAIPSLKNAFATHRDYSQAHASRILAAAFRQPTVFNLRFLASAVFLNRTNRFAMRPLPRAAQMAPAFSVNVADLDGDGHEDIFLSQNFFAQDAATPRLDAGRGLWLRGKGDGDFQEWSGDDSGVKVYGEQRGAALADFDEDGRPDLVLSQNGAATKLYRNAGGKPGLRVRLSGPPNNPDGIGARLRLTFKDGPGAMREIHGGGGYWSQDSTVVVLATPQTPVALEVYWPGGQKSAVPIAASAREVTVRVAP